MINSNKGFYEIGISDINMRILTQKIKDVGSKQMNALDENHVVNRLLRFTLLISRHYLGVLYSISFLCCLRIINVIFFTFTENQCSAYRPISFLIFQK